MKDDPLLSFVDFSNVHILRAREVETPAWARTLISIDGKPLAKPPHAALAADVARHVGDGVALISRDITDRKLAESKRDENRSFLKSLLDFLPLQVYAKSLRPDGLGLLLQAPWPTILSAGVFATAIVLASASAASGYFQKTLNGSQRALFGLSGLLLLGGGPLQYAGAAVFAAALILTSMSGKPAGKTPSLPPAA